MVMSNLKAPLEAGSVFLKSVVKIQGVIVSDLWFAKLAHRMKAPISGM